MERCPLHAHQLETPDPVVENAAGAVGPARRLFGAIGQARRAFGAIGPARRALGALGSARRAAGADSDSETSIRRFRNLMSTLSAARAQDRNDYSRDDVWPYASEEIQNEYITGRRPYSVQSSQRNFQSTDNPDQTVHNSHSMEMVLSELESFVIPPPDPKILESISRDFNKIITINGRERIIRFYDQTAITFLSNYEPRTVTFQRLPANIIIDDIYIYQCFYGGPAMGFVLDHKFHTIRLGTPMRELYIDNVAYRCLLNGPPIKCVIDNATRYVKIAGNPPAIELGKTKRYDLVAGISQIRVDDNYQVLVYLDAKPQCIDIGRHTLVLRFVDKFKAVLINNQYFVVDYGGKPLKIRMGGYWYSLKFQELPSHVQPGFTSVNGMIDMLPKVCTTNVLKSIIGCQKCWEDAIMKDLQTNSYITSSSETRRSEEIDNISDTSKLSKEIMKYERSKKIASLALRTATPNNGKIISALYQKNKNKNQQYIMSNSLVDINDTEQKIKKNLRL